MLLLVYTVEKNGVRPDSKKITTIIELPLPVDVMGLWTILGLCRTCTSTCATTPKHIDLVCFKKCNVVLKRWLSVLIRTYQAKLEAIADFDDCRARQTIPYGLRCNQFYNWLCTHAVRHRRR